MRADQSLDAALITVVLALFTASAFGLTELAGGEVLWEPKEWKGVHDSAKGLILPLLMLRLGLALHGRVKEMGLRNRLFIAMALCWVGDIALTFSGDGPFLVGLVSFLLGHLFYILAFRHLYATDWPVGSLLNRCLAGGVMLVVASSVALVLWKPAGDLGPAVALYALVIAAMAYCSWAAAKGPGVWALRIGASAFVISDVILAFGRFGEAPVAHGRLWVMGTYIVAQWALAVGFTEVALNREASRL